MRFRLALLSFSHTHKLTVVVHIFIYQNSIIFSNHQKNKKKENRKQKTNGSVRGWFARESGEELAQKQNGLSIFHTELTFRDTLFIIIKLFLLVILIIKKN